MFGKVSIPFLTKEEIIRVSTRENMIVISQGKEGKKGITLLNYGGIWTGYEWDYKNNLIRKLKGSELEKLLEKLEGLLP